MRRWLAWLVPLSWMCAAGPALAGIPPAGFQETEVAGGIDQITGFEWSSNGDLWIISKPGIVRVLHPGAAQPVIALTLNVNTVDERGLGGIAVDPNYSTNQFLYLYYTVATAPVHNRVSRFRAAGDTLVDETVLLEGPELIKVFHNAGHMEFGPNGLLYIAMGDNAQPAMSQRLDTLLGKILRIGPDGSIPAGNPFVGDPGARPEVWAYGLRNPWRFNIQPETGNLFIADVGDAGWEELDLGVAGANYGYPLVEGPQPPGVAGTTYPIFSYSHNGGSASITGGDHMEAGNFPSQYVGDYFYGDFIFNKIFRMTLDPGNLPASNEEFVLSADSPVHIRVGPDGALYYASFLMAAIYRVAYVGGSNQQPVAVIQAAPLSGLPPLQVQFDGTGSFDPDGAIVGYRWQFGDGTPPSESATPLHTYTRSGVFLADLRVGDGLAVDHAPVRIVAGNRAPSAAIFSPADGTSFNAGDVISFSGAASDPEDGTLGSGAFTWSVLFHHQTHTHPYLGPTPAVSSGSFMAADSGEPDSDVWYEIRMSATDSGAPLGPSGWLSDTRSVSVYPNLSTMTFATQPRAGLGLTLDGKPLTPPQNVIGVVGFKRVIEALSPQSPGDGHTYRFQLWSDGGARLHTITTPAASATFSATFVCNLLAEVGSLQVSPAAGGKITLSWTPPADLCLSSGPVVYVIYAASTARPSSPPGLFPTDPRFFVIASTSAASVTITPAAGNQFYLVVGMGSDGALGPVGHYGR